MKLYYEPAATTCRPVTLFAAEHEIGLDLVHVDLFAGEHLRPDYEELNLDRRVPLLVDGELRLTECSAILKYLADLSGSGAYPRDLARRAQINAAMDWFNTGFMRDFCYGLVYSRYIPDYAPPPSAAAEMLARAEERSRSWLQILDRRLAETPGPYLFGRVISLADYIGAPYATLGELIGFDFSRWANVQRWLAAMRSRPCWDEVNAAFYGWSSAVRAQAA